MIKVIDLEMEEIILNYICGFNLITCLKSGESLLAVDREMNVRRTQSTVTAFIFHFLFKKIFY